MDVAEDRNMLIDRLGLKQNTQDNADNRINSIQDELPTNINSGSGSSRAGIEHINGRITKLEHSIVELTNTINGVMNELMDQKSILNTLNSNAHGKNRGGANMRGAEMQEGRHLLRPHHQHGFNIKNAGNINDDPEGSSRLHVQHNQNTDAQQGNRGTGSDPNYIIADIDRSAQNRDDGTRFKGEYIIADDSPAPAKKKQESNVHYNEEEDVVVYVNEKDDK